MSASPAEASRSDFDTLARLAILSVAVGAAFAFAVNMVDPDLWGHVQYGRDLIRDGELPATATHTFTTPDHPWVNHENLAELAFAAGFERLGVPGMLIAKCLWGMTIVGLMLLAARRLGVAWITAWGLMLPVSLGLGAFFPMRPQIFSFMWCAIVLLLLDLAFKRRGDDTAGTVRWTPLLILPLIIAAWTNSHGGFVAGLGITLAYLGGRALEGVVLRRPDAWRNALCLAGVGIACCMATLANPYGIELHRWIAYSLGSPRPEITEWAATKVTDPVFIPLVVLGAFALGVGLWSRRRRDWVELVILALVAWQAVSHVRHVAFFALLCGFWLPAHVQSIADRVRASTSSKLPQIGLAPWMKWTAATTVWVALAAQSYALGHRLVELPVYRDMYPVDAVQFMGETGLEGKLVVSFNWAQYALMALPDCPVAFDGRFRTCYPQEVVDMHFDFLLGEHKGNRHRSPDSGEIDGLRVFTYGNPELTLVDRHAYVGGKNMRRAAEGEVDGTQWTLLYQDRVAEVWGRSDVFDDPSSPRYLPPSDRIVGEHFSKTSRPWPALPIIDDTDSEQTTGVTEESVARTQNQSSTDQRS